MIVFEDLDAARTARCMSGPEGQLRRPVTAIGFFDGLHLGHQRVLADLKAWARQNGQSPAVVTFDRPPREVLSGFPVPTVSSLRHRLVLLAREGIETALVLAFDRDLAAWTPEVFIARVLKEALGTGDILLGFDSTFGRDRQGTYEFLKAREAELGIRVRRAEACLIQGVRVSSTRARDAVAAGDLPALVTLLGRSYTLLGDVVPGDRRGRTLGFPTANLLAPGQVILPDGVYFAHAALPELPMRQAGAGAFRITGAIEGTWPAVVNIGRRPTFGKSGSRLIEVHLLGFSGDLYGRSIEVTFLCKHRDERPFAGPDALAQQLKKDVNARRAFNVLPG